MKPLVLITGMMRTGTSLVAELVHRLGWPVACTMTPPIPPSWRMDWEDFELTLRLVHGERFTVKTLREYLELRRQYSQRWGFRGRFAVKSPYLALVWPELLAACPVRPYVIQCRRDEEARQRSFDAHPQLSKLDDERIFLASAGIRPDLVVHYESFLTRPLGSVDRLARELGVCDADAVDAAFRLVGQPTTYPCPSQPPQSQVDRSSSVGI